MWSTSLFAWLDPEGIAMNRYRYRAIGADGAIVKGELMALNVPDVQAKLMASGFTLTKATEIKSKGASSAGLNRTDLINFMFHMQMLLRAGVPIVESLQDLSESADSPALKRVSASLLDRIQGGSTFADAMAAEPGVFSEVTVQLIRSGEITGQLPDVLNDLVKSLKWQAELAAQTKKLLMYPAFVTVTISAVVIFLMVYLVPQLVGFIVNMGQEVPFQTRMLIFISDAFVRFWWIIIPTPILLVIAVVVAARSNEAVRFKVHVAILNLPWLGPVIKKINLARLADSFALMYRTGIPITEALEFCQKITGNMAIQQAVERARARIITGSPLSDAFAAEHLFPSLVVRMLRVGEATGGLDTALANVSYFYNRDIDESISRVQALIEPVLTVVLGLILGWIMLAVLGPIYDTISKIKV